MMFLCHKREVTAQKMKTLTSDVKMMVSNRRKSYLSLLCSITLQAVKLVLQKQLNHYCKANV